MTAATTTVKVLPADLAQKVADQATVEGVTPMQEAGIFNALRTAGYSNDEIGEMTGHRACFVGWRLDLLTLCELGQLTLEAGKLPVNLAGYIAKLGPVNQGVMLTRWELGQFATCMDAEKHAQGLIREESMCAEREQAMQEAERLERDRRMPELERLASAETEEWERANRSA
ncbi:hypothetical protein DI272_18885 [Streptomyces sp. Act143]|uniref:hypothetical protein n=1 Tax=Streptomyces sp. Act143 TaxID=2200760 RepID=UPI000D681CA7|nr:hypothetical protein [Streptomyces sp. Act143]PWI15999.1 hypothetical protein DI272_18885 [Streptomyces sp. Act143]